jgi:ABC-type polysaccharide/polyol phosphate export permease
MFVPAKRAIPLLRTVRAFVLRDLKEQYAGTLLGVLWALLQPLSLVLVYWWVFGYVWSLRVPSFRPEGGEFSFVVFLLAGLLPWLAFLESLNKGVHAITARADVLRQGAFPAFVLPIARVLSAHAVYAVLLASFVLAVRTDILVASPGIATGVVLLFALQIAVAIGLALLLSALTVYVRDLAHVVGMVLTAIFFTAPILYPLLQVPEALRALLWINPYTPFALGFQSLTLEGLQPSFAVWAQAFCSAVLACFVGGYVFRRLRPGFADAL